jgi:hypothetical protein
MDSLAYPIFLLISNFVLHGFKEAMDSAYLNFVHAISLIALAVEVTYVTHYGYLIAFQKSTDAVPEPNLRELAYHAVIVILILWMLNKSSLALDALMGLRQMIIGSFTGDYDASGGAQVSRQLGFIDTAYAFSNVINSTNITEDLPDIKSNAVGLAIIAENSPQISGGIMLLINEITVRTGMALFPIALYTTLYRVTSGFFSSWFDLMFSSTIQMGVLVLMLSMVFKATVAFLALLASVTLATRFLPIGGYYVSELQLSVIESGFGFLMSLLIVWVPAQASTFSGRLLNGAASAKGHLGSNVTLRDFELREPDQRTVKPREVQQRPPNAPRPPSNQGNNQGANPANAPRRQQ